MSTCKLLEKLDENGGVLKEEELEVLLEIVRRQLKFMMKYNILMTPKNFERWFIVFCYIVENKESLSDKDIFHLYGRFYEKHFKIDNEKHYDLNQKEVSDKLEKLADQIEEKLSEILNISYLHKENVIRHEKIVQNYHDDKFSKILDELRHIREQNEKLTEKLEI